jgi:hypothetical protein
LREAERFEALMVDRKDEAASGSREKKTAKKEDGSLVPIQSEWKRL